MSEKSKNVSEVVLTEIIPFTKGLLMGAPADDLEGEEAALAYKLVDFVEKLCKARKEALKPELKTFADEEGKETSKGGKIVACSNGFKVTHERRRSSAPSVSGIKALLKEAGIPVTEAFNEIKKLELNPSKVAFLVETGKIDKDEVEKCHGITWALKVTESKETKALLESAK